MEVFERGGRNLLEDCKRVCWLNYWFGEEGNLFDGGKWGFEEGSWGGCF